MGQEFSTSLGCMILVQMLPKVVSCRPELQEAGLGLGFTSKVTLTWLSAQSWLLKGGFWFGFLFLLLFWFLSTSLLSAGLFEYILKTGRLAFPRVSSSEDSGRSSHLLQDLALEATPYFLCCVIGHIGEG